MQEGNLIYVFQHKIHKLIDLVVKFLITNKMRILTSINRKDTLYAIQMHDAGGS